MTDPEGDDKSALDRTLDVFVYLPVGFVLDFPRSIPRYIARGRRQLDPSRLLGRETPTVDPRRQIERLHEQTRNTLRGLGVGTGNRTNGDSARTAVSEQPAATPPATPRLPEPVAPAPVLDFTVDELAITDYDSLSASQVVPRLDSLAPDELETVRQYEVATRGRKTILSKIALLQTST